MFRINPMWFASCLPAIAALAFFLVLPALPATAQADDSAEVPLWNVVRKSQDPADYSTFLKLYPNGRFAALARMKLAKLGGTPPVPPNARSDVNNAPQPATPELYRLNVSPRVATMGQSVTVRCEGFDAPAMFDRIVVVQAGAADFDASGKVDETKLYWNGLPKLYDCAGAGITLPMMMAGSYEVRYLSRQYNPDGVLQVVARAGFQNQ